MKYGKLVNSPHRQIHGLSPPVPETPAPSRTCTQVASLVGSTSVISVPRHKVPTTIPVVEIQRKPVTGSSKAKKCNSKKHNCSTVSDPQRFLQMVEDLRLMINLGPEALSRALMHAIELRQDCDQLHVQLVRLLTRLDDATDEIVLHFANMNDLLPSNFVPFFFEDSANVAQLQQMMFRMRQYHPHPSLEIGHLERNPTSAIETR
ncbi:hypothetical protein B0H13DRAFT_2392313 [Mycena leptocephala]|nr:hypothetical protein B0H13DRAFT_2392313 [Mycena leptocephala]